MFRSLLDPRRPLTGGALSRISRRVLTRNQNGYSNLLPTNRTKKVARLAFVEDVLAAPLVHSLNGFRLHQTAMYLER